MKKQVASTAVIFEKKVAEARAPNTVPDAPAPNPAPESAPLPRWMSTSTVMPIASEACTNSRSVCSICLLDRPRATSGRGGADPQKFVDLQGRSADESTVDIGHGEQLRGIGRLDTAAVHHPERGGDSSIPSPDPFANEGVDLLCLL